MAELEADRVLASIVTVSDIIPIIGADKIVLAQIKGWKCIVKINEFVKGDLAVYFEIDSVVDKDDPTFNFLNGKFRIKTIKLRGVLSQGLLLPLSCLSSKGYDISTFKEGDDVTDKMNVKKYIPIEELSQYTQQSTLNSSTNKPYPHYCPKTDEIRLQNNLDLLDQIKNRLIVITRKEDGCSCTFSIKNGIFGMHSRNMTITEQDSSNIHYFHIATKFNIQQKMESFGKNIAIQGEIVGPKINSNRLKLTYYDFRVFNIFDIDTQTYLDFSQVLQICSQLELNTVPIIFNNNSNLLDITLDYFLNLASNTFYDSEKTIYAEGIVIKTTDGEPRISFKVISNEYLLKHKL